MRLAFLTALLLIVTAGEPVSAPRAYLDTALGLLQQYSMESPKADWPRLRAQAHRDIAHAQRPADTYRAINRVIARLGNSHTFLDASAAGGATSTVGTTPDGRMIGTTAYLRIPAVSSDHGEAYVDAGRRVFGDLLAARPRSWVVDLRGNGGGDMHPMLTVVAPLLGEGRTGSFVGPHGGIGDWGVRDGHVYNGDEVAFPQVKMQAAVDGPVAVLVDGQTASSGEAILISFTGAANARSFGEPTTGFATANNSFELPDGARLAITMGHMTDRTGRAYGNAPIAPHTVVDTRKALDAAIEWLTTRQR